MAVFPGPDSRLAQRHQGHFRPALADGAHPLRSSSKSPAWTNIPGSSRRKSGQTTVLQVQQNGEVAYTLRGLQVKVTALWNYQAPAGGRDTHYALFRGTRANLVIRQGAEQNYPRRFTLKMCPASPPPSLKSPCAPPSPNSTVTWPGLEVEPAGTAWEIVVPAKYDVGHEAHFGQVTEQFLRYLAAGKIPEWETAGMLAKYYTTTEAYRLAAP